MKWTLHLFVLLGAIGLASHDAPAAEDAKPVVAMIGPGTLASTFGPAIGRAGYTVVYGSRDPQREAVRKLVQQTGAKASATSPREAAAGAQIVILAVPRDALDEVTAGLGPLDGKIVVDVSAGMKRVAADGYLELIPGESNSERIQAAHPRARVVRINLPLMAYFVDPLLAGTPPTVMIAGDHSPAREAVARLIFGGVVDRHPGLRFWLAHGGGVTPALAGRLRHGWRVRPETRGAVGDPMQLLRNSFWFDSLTHDPDTTASLVRRFGADRVVLGSDSPFDMQDADPWGSLVRALPDRRDRDRVVRASHALLEMARAG